jgi:dipeptidyl aminopeptidase/acylaminoacyl peptidase
MDAFAVEELNEITFAADGSAIAFTRQRPATSQITNGLILDETRRDVWVQLAPHQVVRNLTTGQTDSSGWWAPQWSPDGQHLAMLSTRGGTVQLWVWERANTRLRQLTSSGVDHGHLQGGGGCLWADSQRLLCQMMNPGQPATALGRGGYRVGIGVQRAESAWAKAKRGERTASVLSTTEFPLAVRRLVIVDVATGTEQLVAPTTADYGLRSWWLAPGGRMVAVQQPVPANEPLGFRDIKGYPGTVILYTLDGRQVPLARPLPANVVTRTLRWSPDGRELAFFALEERAIHPEVIWGDFAATVQASPAPSKEYPGRLWRVQIASGTVELWPTGDVDLGQGTAPPDFEWTARNELLFQTVRLIQGARPVSASKPVWLVLGRDGKTRIGADSLAVTTAAAQHELAARRRFEQSVAKPDPDARLVAYVSQSQTGIMQADTHKGTFLWRVRAGTPAEQLLAINDWYQQITKPQQRLIEYTSLSGKPYKGVLTLPYGYVQGQRVPLVVDSDTYYTPETVPQLFVLDSATASPQWRDGPRFAAAGYAYLWASMPVTGVGDEMRENLSSFPDGILPAVDKVVAMGVADPKRVFLYGASSMGFGVYGLVTQTTRFTAAVSWVGFAEHEYLRLSTYSHARYGDAAHDIFGSFRYHDPAPGHRGIVTSPVWRVGDFLRRKSPLMYVDRVQTPLLIADGDLDGPLFMQNELFFNALVQLRKPAQFVRYWGEGHGWNTPANVVDWYQRVFAWYDQWGDIARDARGYIAYDNGLIKSRGGLPALKPDAYANFAPFRPAVAQGGASRPR